MSGGMNTTALRSRVGCIRSAGGGAGTVAGFRTIPGYPPSQSPVSVLPPQLIYQGTTMAGDWPLRDFVELGALDTAVPCARLRSRQVLWEWGLDGFSERVELLVSELMSNAIKASRSVDFILPVRLWLLSDKQRLVVLVWDANPGPPMRIDVSDEAESGRGLVLVEAVSDEWGSYPTPDMGGKVVWALVNK